MDQDRRGVIRLGKPANQVADANSFAELLTKYSSLWRQTGLKLGLISSVLDNIEADYSKQRDRFERTLNDWLRLDGDRATWGVLELAMTNANRVDLGIPVLPKLPAHVEVDIVKSVERTQQSSDGQKGSSVDSHKQATVCIGMLTSEPKMDDLLEIVIPKIKAYWEDVAIFLQFKIHEIDGIKEKHREDPKKCCKQVLMDWLNSNKGATPKTWPTLLAKLGKVEELTAVLEEIKTATVTP